MPVGKPVRTLETFALSVTSALLSTLSSFVSCASVINLLFVASVKLVVVNVGVAPLTTDWSSAFTSASEAHSESIKAPALVTLAVSVTSADVSIVSNFVPSVCKSLPSTVPPTTRLLATVNVPDTFKSVKASTTAADEPAPSE
mgnify:CR=1 FL=1